MWWRWRSPTESVVYQHRGLIAPSEPALTQHPINSVLGVSSAFYASPMHIHHSSHVPQNCAYNQGHAKRYTESVCATVELHIFACRKSYSRTFSAREYYHHTEKLRTPAKQKFAKISCTHTRCQNYYTRPWFGCNKGDLYSLRPNCDRIFLCPVVLDVYLFNWGRGFTVMF